MNRILVTGATGNIGKAVIHYLNQQETNCELIAAVRSVENAKHKLANYPAVSFRTFDFAQPTDNPKAFQGIDVLFLLRPPQISDVERYIRPLLQLAKDTGIQNVVFLSVQGAERSKVIPHNKIEYLIEELGLNYIFVRPSYFMQNLTTTLLPEIQNQQRITLPAGQAKFNWIDVQNIGEATGVLILNFAKFQNQIFEITGTENATFGTVTKLMSEVVGKEIAYHPVNPIRFYFHKRREGMEGGFAMVMTLLHFLPRLQKPPVISDNYHKLTGKHPTPLRAFLEREKAKFSI